MTSPTAARPPATVVKVGSPADLLRLVPHLVPADTRDSVVLVLFRGRRTNGAMRVDLPHGADADRLRAWASRILGTACKVEGVDGVVAVACTGATFAPSGRPPEADALRALGRQAERMGLDVRDLLCVAADGWGSLLDPELPRGGRPLDELAAKADDPAPAVRQLPEPVLAADPVRRVFWDAVERWWGHPEGPGGVLHGVDLRRPGSAFGPAASLPPAMERYRHGGDQQDVVELIERMLDPHAESDADAPCPCRALLYSIGRRQGLENLLLVQFGWGRELGAQLWAAAHSGDQDAPALELLTTAMGGGAIRRPDPDRIDAAIAVLTQTGRYVPPTLRAPIDGMLSWLHWAIGAGSLAGRLAERALAADPDRDVPRLVLHRTGAGELPEWAFRADPAAADPFSALAG